MNRFDGGRLGRGRGVDVGKQGGQRLDGEPVLGSDAGRDLLEPLHGLALGACGPSALGELAGGVERCGQFGQHRT
ncbi:hypothetical protein, partial [Streptomyces decoyicus]